MHEPTIRKLRISPPIAVVFVVVTVVLPGCSSGEVAQDAKVGSTSSSATPRGGGQANHAAQSTAPSYENWRRSMLSSRLLAKGCFHAVHPDTRWEEVPCNSSPLCSSFPFGCLDFDVGGENISPSLETGGMTGGGATISSAEGSFQVTNVSSVYSEHPGSGVTINDEYSVQLNTTSDFNVPVCADAADPAHCYSAPQFVFANYGSSYPGRLTIVYWIMNYGDSCPLGWAYHGNSSCVKRGPSIDIAENQPITNLANLKLTATVTSDGADTLTLSTGSDIYALNPPGQESYANLAQRWNFVEFNVFGSDGSARAVFNPNATILVQTILTSSTTSSPTFSKFGMTAESNNLNFVQSSYCAFGGTEPKIQFLESNANPPPQPPFCLLNDITPIELPLQ